jgi:chitinase
MTYATTKSSVKVAFALTVLALLASLVFAAVPRGTHALAPAWAPNTAYAVNQLASYGGQDYKCIQAHTSLTGWEPPNVPALWQLQAGGGATATKTATTQTGPTNTPTKTATAGGPTNTPTKTATSGGAPSPTTCQTNCGTPGHILLGYFAEWGIYGRNYHPKNIVTSGSASKLTHINFAFGNVQGGACTIGDAYADYDKAYTAAESVDGVADTWDQPLRGLFNQFKKLKVMYPNIKVIWSFGGWTWSGGFGAAAANATAFANSCYNLVNDPRWAGVFSGVDLDWEYPNACGLSCDASGFSSFKTLMQAMRSRFGSQLVTAAITADGTSGGKIDAADYGGASASVNWYNVMTYDFFGAWAASGPTAPHSPLTTYTGIPIAGFDSASAIAKLKSKGVPSSKLLLGIGFYGRGWTGVTQTAPGGSATGAAPGTYEAGIEDYKILSGSCPSSGTIAGTSYSKCGSNWWSFDTPSTIATKMSWKNSQGLGGTFFWEFSGDTSSGSLISAIKNGN